MGMNDHQQWKEFQAKLRQSGATSVYAARALLVKEYTDQERQRKEDCSFSKSDNNDAPEIIVRGTDSRRRSICSGDGLSSSPDSNVLHITARGRRASIASHFSADADRSHESATQNLHSSGSLSGQQERLESVSGSKWLKQLTGGLSMEEKARRQASTERREGFDTMINSLLGNEKLETKTTRRGSLPHLSEESHNIPSVKRRASVDAEIPALRRRRDSIGSADTSLLQPRRSSFGGAMEDLKQRSAYHSTVDDDDDDTDGEDVNSTEITFNRKLSSPLTKFSTRSASYSEPVEIDTDGKVKIFSFNEDEQVLVDFPSRDPVVPRFSFNEDEQVLVDFPSRDPGVVPRFQQVATRIKQSIFMAYC